jgi:glycosyltransferase involved in cell wall biosynthesis
MDVANYALASFLARRGHAVELVTHRAAADLLELPNTRARLARKPLGSYFLGRWPLRWAAGRAAKQAQGRVVANGGNYIGTDVNWVHYVHAAFEPPARRTLKQRIERTLERRAERDAVRAARVVVCNSNRTGRVVIEKLGANPDRVRTVYYGTDPTRFHPATETERAALRERLQWPTDRPVVMFIGALGDRRKGFDTLFEAWSQLCQKPGWDAVLVVVGRGAELAMWTERGAPLDIRFLGFRDDVPDLLRAADALVSPTRYEAYGLGVHEALCCGLPAIVSANAGVAERYPQDLHDLLLPNPDDATDLVARLERWRNTMADSRKQVQELSELLRTYTWETMGNEFLKAIGEHG